MSQVKAVIVEDDEVLGALFVEILDEVGLQTKLVRDGAGAFECIAEIMPDLVLLDMHLPHVSGVEILRRIRSDNQLKTIKVLVVTADALLAQSMEEIADVAFTKPVSYRQLKDMVSRLTQPAPKLGQVDPT